MEYPLDEHVDLFGVWSDMCANTDIFSLCPPSSCELIVDAREEHLVEEQYELTPEFSVFGFISDIAHHFGEIASLIDFSDMDIATRLHLHEDLLSIRECECRVLDRV